MDGGAIERERAGTQDAAAGLDLWISGMSCAACVRRVERALQGVPGVLSAEVNLASERARVRVAAGTAGADELAAAVRAAGYEAAVPAPAGVAAEERPGRDGLAAAAACALALPLLLPMLAMPFGIHAALPGWA